MAVTLRDRYIFINRTSVELEWRQEASGGAAQPGALPLPANDAPVPLRWQPTIMGRQLCVRPSSGSHLWCEPFAVTTGNRMIKLHRNWRRFRRSTAQMGVGEGDSEFGDRPMHLHLEVAMHGGQCQLILTTVSSRHLFPLQVANDSSLLLAFRQEGAT
eukprot:6205066-Prymnesium_polylepis.1